MDKWMARGEQDLKVAFDSHSTSAILSIIKTCLPSGSKSSSNTNRLKDVKGNITSTYALFKVIFAMFLMVKAFLLLKLLIITVLLKFLILRGV